MTSGRFNALAVFGLNAPLVIVSFEHSQWNLFELSVINLLIGWEIKKQLTSLWIFLFAALLWPGSFKSGGTSQSRLSVSLYMWKCVCSSSKRRSRLASGASSEAACWVGVNKKSEKKISNFSSLKVISHRIRYQTWTGGCEKVPSAVVALLNAKYFSFFLSEDPELCAEASCTTVPASPKIVVESDCTSQASGCPSHSSVDEEDDVPITDIYFVSIL